MQFRTMIISMQNHYRVYLKNIAFRAVGERDRNDEWKTGKKLISEQGKEFLLWQKYFGSVPLRKLNLTQ